jgi:hypothetical protein
MHTLQDPFRYRDDDKRTIVRTPLGRTRSCNSLFPAKGDELGHAYHSS